MKRFMCLLWGHDFKIGAPSFGPRFVCSRCRTRRNPEDLVERRLGYVTLEDSKVSSNDALVTLIKMLPADEIKMRMIASIEAHGLTWNQRSFVESVADPIVADKKFVPLPSSSPMC